MTIRQGDVFWINLDEPQGSEPGYRHPHVVIQNDLYNGSRIRTVVVCAITSNMQRARDPGNVVLEKGEANLSKDCVVNVTQIFTVDKNWLDEYIGTLSNQKLEKVIEGIRYLIMPVGAKM